jgi:16S rRNA (guanine966-N2)-methyltransferase
MLSMTRIIGGLAGSIKLNSPAKATRPTSDRIRESIFSRLEARDLIDGVLVLDLYAGTGALALEAVSRGAGAACMVERDGKAAAVCVANSRLIQKSLEKEDVETETKVVNKAVASFLATNVDEYDLVFIDPPYEISNEEVVENLSGLKLAKDAVVIVERSSRTDAPIWPAGFELEDTKDYGDTVVYWLKAS